MTAKMAARRFCVPIWRIAKTTEKSPIPDSTAPTVSKGRSGSAGSGSTTPRRLNRRIATITSAWKTKAARQLMNVVIAPPISGPAAAPRPAAPMIAPKALAREVRSLKASVVRM